MQFRKVLLAIAGAMAAVHATPLVERQATELPKADCCSCDVSVPGYVCTVPKDGICITNKAYCPFDPETQEQCCCCDPNTPAQRCRLIPKGEGCMCTAVACPFDWKLSYLPLPHPA
ncbi:hypothetical protein EsH8_IV_000902 [Colletotrichum jinshuiense]